MRLSRLRRCPGATREQQHRSHRDNNEFPRASAAYSPMVELFHWLAFLSCAPPLKLMEERLRIQVIDLFEHGVRQFHPVYFPPPLSGISPIIKIFIRCFQPAKVVSVHLRSPAHASPSSNPNFRILSFSARHRFLLLPILQNGHGGPHTPSMLDRMRPSFSVEPCRRAGFCQRAPSCLTRVM